MHAATVALSRRLVLRGLVAAGAVAALPGRAAETIARDLTGLTGGAPDFLVVAAADLHSPYRRLPRVLAAMRALRDAFPGTPCVFAVNGDLFERGNAAARRSGGTADLAFLSALAAEGPTLFNLGNHETALADDLAGVVATLEGAGAQVIGSVVDARTGRLFAPASARVGLGGRRLAALGLAPDNPFVWRREVRGTLSLLDPVGFAADAGPGAFAGADFPLLLSHAGVTADKAILPGLPEGAGVVGGHDHLTFRHETPALGYAHGGAWGTGLTVIAYREGAAPAAGAASVEALAEAGDEALEAAVAAVLAEHLTEEDRAVIGVRAAALDLPASILFAVEAVRAAAEADLALLGHTTFGQPLPAGEVTRFDLDAFVRFDGEIMAAEVPGARLAEILGRANQHLAATLEARTGDFVHAAALEIEPARTYRLAVNGWTARNQRAYLGTEDLAFEEVPGLRLKAIVAEAIAAG